MISFRAMLGKLKFAIGRAIVKSFLVNYISPDFWLKLIVWATRDCASVIELEEKFGPVDFSEKEDLILQLLEVIRLKNPGKDLPRSKQDRGRAQCLALIGFVSMFVPKKVNVDYLGDEIELIDYRAEAGMRPWRNQLHTLIAVFWALYFTAKEFVAPAAILGTLWKFLK